MAVDAGYRVTAPELSPRRACEGKDRLCVAGRISGDVPESPEFMIPFGKAAIRREGTDCSLVSYSRGVHQCLRAADILAKEGIECEVVDLRTLVPLDIETIVKSVIKTHRAVVFTEEPKNMSFALDWYTTRRVGSTVAKAPEHLIQYDFNWKF